MATWIVHLRLAENLLAHIRGLDAPAFALGNIAPDSGIPDANWEKFDPLPELTHFVISDSDQLADLDFYRQYLAHIDPVEVDADRYSFLLGYFCHLVTDNLWSLKIGRPTQARFAAEFAANPKFGWTIKEDWYGLDFIYVRDHPASLFWRVFLGLSVTQAYLDFLPLAALQQRVTYIQDYYQKQDEWVQQAYRRPYVYLSQAAVDDFVEQSSHRLAQIITQLGLGLAPTVGPRSTLQLSDRHEPV